MLKYSKSAFGIAYLWSLFGKLLIRGIGLISTLFLVRLLQPKDFGVFALGTAILGLFYVIAEIGTKRFLVINQVKDPNLLNAAWTMRMCLNGSMILAVYFMSSYISEYFGQPQLIMIIKLLCLAEFCFLFQNIGIISYEMRLDYKPLQIMELQAKIFSTAVCLTAAFLLRSYYALLYGYIANYLCLTLLSYFYTDHKVRLVFKYPKGLLKFSLFLIFRNLAGYLRSKIDVFFVGKAFGASSVGKYSVSQEFAILPLSEIASPASKPLFNLLSSNKNLGDKYEQTYKFMSVLYLFIIPSIVGVYFTADNIASVLLDNKWDGAGDLIRLLSVLMLPFTLQPLMNNLYDFNGKGFVSGIVDIIGILAIILGGALLQLEELADFAQYRFLIAIAIFLLILLFAKYLINISTLRVFDAVFIPSIASCVMGLLLSSLDLDIHGLLALLLKVTFGAVSYFFLIFFLVTALRKFSPSGRWLFNTAAEVLLKYKRNKAQLD